MHIQPHWRPKLLVGIPIVLVLASVATTTAALAWSKPSISATCATSVTTDNFTITGEANQVFDDSWGSENTKNPVGSFTTNSSGVYDLTILRVTGQKVLFIWYKQDSSAVNSATADEALCSTPTPTGTSTPTATATPTPPTATPTPTATATPTPTGTPTPTSTPTPKPSTSPPPVPNTGGGSGTPPTGLGLGLLLAGSILLLGTIGISFIAYLIRRRKPVSVP